MNAYPREYTFNPGGSEHEVYQSKDWSKITLCDHGSGIGSITLNRRKRSAVGSYDDAFQLRLNVIVEFLLGPGDILYAQGNDSDLMEVTATPLPFSGLLGPRPFPALTGTVAVPLADGATRGTRINPSEFCQIHILEAASLPNGVLVGINKSALLDGDDIVLFGDLYRFKANREDSIYVLGQTDVAQVGYIITPLPRLSGVIGELVC